MSVLSSTKSIENKSHFDAGTSLRSPINIIKAKSDDGRPSISHVFSSNNIKLDSVISYTTKLSNDIFKKKYLSWNTHSGRIASWYFGSVGGSELIIIQYAKSACTIKLICIGLSDQNLQRVDSDILSRLK